MKVLVIDTVGKYEKLFDDILGRYKFNMKFVSSSKKAESMIPEFKPQMIAMSLNSNEEWAFLSKLKNSTETSSLPIVGITSDIKRKNEYQGRFEMMEIFAEPVKLKNVRHAIQRWTHYGSLYRNDKK